MRSIFNMAYPGGIGFSELLYREHANLLNAARSLIEKCPCAYGCPSCVGPTLEGHKEKCKNYFGDTCKEESSNKICALKIMNEYSHEENAGHSLKFPDLNELDASIDFILGTIEEKDNEHYRALSSSINI